MISNKTKYAIKALVALARKKEPMTIQEIAVQESIPKKFLEAILLELRKHSILGSKIGIGGGYYLLKNPADILLSQVLRISAGPIALLPCASPNFYERCDDCPEESACSLREVVLEVREATLTILADTTIEDMVNKEKKLKVKSKKNWGK